MFDRLNNQLLVFIKHKLVKKQSSLMSGRVCAKTYLIINPVRKQRTNSHSSFSVRYMFDSIFTLENKENYLNKVIVLLPMIISNDIKKIKLLTNPWVAHNINWFFRTGMSEFMNLFLILILQKVITNNSIVRILIFPSGGLFRWRRKKRINEKAPRLIQKVKYVLFNIPFFTLITVHHRRKSHFEAASLVCEQRAWRETRDE